jgi:(p)ppGpp synthase/HD superfamily hydrolase
MYSDRFADALALAAHLHRHQRRKGTAIPYVSHLLAVAAIALEHGANEDEAIAALLHDAIEDQGGAETERLIRERFGDAVADIVVACSDTDVMPKPPWRARKDAYLAHVPTATRSARLVSAADKLHNARTILADVRRHGDEVWARFNGGKEGTLWYYRALVIAYSSVERTPLIEDLEAVVSALELAARGASEPREQRER